MTRLDVRRAARDAVAAHPDRAATAIVHDTPDVRLVVFRLAPGQHVALHRSKSTVQLSVLEGDGVLTGEANGAPLDVPCTAGDVVVYAPDEPHAMRAESRELLLLATITPRPGSR
jgi:quercetin dioxygenase-like cupin family protein